MTQKEQGILQVSNNFLTEHTTLDQAAELMGVSPRHTRLFLEPLQPLREVLGEGVGSSVVAICVVEASRKPSQRTAVASLECERRNLLVVPLSPSHCVLTTNSLCHPPIAQILTPCYPPLIAFTKPITIQHRYI